MTTWALLSIKTVVVGSGERLNTETETLGTEGEWRVRKWKGYDGRGIEGP